MKNLLGIALFSCIVYLNISIFMEIYGDRINQKNIEKKIAYILYGVK